MLEILKYLKARYLSEKGQGMVEYALILAFVVAIAAYLSNSGGIGGALKDTFDSVKDELGKKTLGGA
ncbi:MAG: pilin protein [Selenomonadaceae bacterium]|nr:pilin protein [Selenomonadaceae bacterium]